MRQLVFIISLTGIVSAAGCQSETTRTQKYYSNNEYSRMTYCLGLSDTAMYAAREKLKNRPKQQLVEYYSTKPKSKLNIATVEKVYAAEFTNAWDYNIQFFQECALNLAGVPQSRVRFASYCLQNALIADTAYAFKKYGYPKEQAYKKFENFKSKTPQEIIDRVYAGSGSRGEEKLDAWRQCMTKISGD